jgi:hypothetical protein
MADEVISGLPVLLKKTLHSLYSGLYASPPHSGIPDRCELPRGSSAYAAKYDTASNYCQALFRRQVLPGSSKKQ